MIVKNIVHFLVYFLIFSSVTAQVNKNIQPAALAVLAGFNDFKHIEGNQTYQGFKNLKPSIAINYLNGLSDRLDFVTMVSASELDFTNKESINYGMGNKKLLLEIDGTIRAKLLPYPAIINPFIQAGVGGSGYDNYYGVFIPLAIGVQAKINSRAFILLNAQYRHPVTRTQDNHFFYSFGIAGNIGKGKQIRQKATPFEKLPAVSRPPQIMPKDTDGDGIIDSLDNCIDLPGFVKYKGCPVPDTDGDSVNDENDSCITIPGLQRYHGCPIPDSDYDGVNDEEDKCPDVKGLISNRGCPLPTDTIKEQINTAAKNIFFITGSYALSAKSFPALDGVVKLLKDHPLIELEIQGHTDNTGAVITNQSLSENRAKAVMKYLVQNGIAKQRLQAQGFGSSRPVTDNSTAEGRTQNRRVEMKIRKE